MGGTRKKDEGTPRSLLGPVTRREALKGVAAAAGFVTLGLKAAVADSRMTGKPVFGSDCRRLNALVPATPGPEYDRLLHEGIADPKGFLTRRFSFTKTQQAALDAATPAEMAAIQGALRNALENKLKLHFDCGAPAAGRTLFSSQKLHIVSASAPASPLKTTKSAPSAAARGEHSTQAVAKAAVAPAFQGTLNFSGPAIH